MTLHVIVEIIHHRMNRDPRCVRRQNRTRRAMFLHVLEYYLFDFEALGDYLNDPIAIRNLFHVVIEISDLNQIRVRLFIQRSRFRFQQRLLCCISDAVPLLLILLIRIG